MMTANNTRDGKLVADWGVVCPWCQEANLGLGYSRRSALRALQAGTWIKVYGLWFCDSGCAEKYRERKKAPK
jgi:hypothetical protein